MRVTPLCRLRRHLPLKGGDHARHHLRAFYAVGDWRKPLCRLISPLEGEMSGRTEGGGIN
ncbi:lytic murein transglycosylase [Salmonella enterica subsp. enterica serovar Java]|nr:lytic murein transglycosylase [Salmonella enterica subsp. enterica serovar Java]